MSISAFQDKIFKSGCGFVVLMVSAAAVAFGIFYTSCGGPGNRGQGQEEQLAAIEVGPATVAPQDLDQSADAKLRQFGMQGAVSPRIRAFALVQALGEKVQELGYIQLATKLGINLDDDSIRQFFIKEIDKEIADARALFESTGKLKKGATDAQFAELFKKERQNTPDELRKMALDNLAAALADPQRKAQLLTQLAPQMVADKLKSQINATDAEVKASYDTYTFKRILISPPGKTPDENQKQAEKVLAEVKGGLPFEAAMDKYSNDPPMAKKKVSESTQVRRRPDLISNPALRPLADLKPGQVSDVITEPVGRTIYKLISIKNDVPADYAKNPAKYREQYINSQAQQQVQAQLQDASKSADVKFPLPGYKALHDYSDVMNEFQSDPKTKVPKLQEIAKEAQAATTDKTFGDEQVAAIVWYAATEDVYNASTDKKSVQPARIKAMQALLQFMESFDVRLALVDIGVEMKDPSMATENLIAATRANNTYDTQGDQHFRQINDKLEQLKKLKLITDQGVQDVAAAQSAWRQQKIDYDKAQKQMKAEQAKQKKEQEAAQKKLEAENKKAMEQQKKTPGPSSATSGTKK